MTRKGAVDVRGHVDHLVVAGDVLMATGWLHVGQELSLVAHVLAGDTTLPVRELAIVRMTRDDVSSHLGSDASPWGFVLFAEIEGEVDPGALSLSFEAGDERIRLTCPTAEAAASPGFVGTIAGARPEERARIRDLVEARMGKFAHGAHGLRRPGELTPPVPAHVDRACLIPGEGVLVHGWILDPTSQLRALHLVSAHGNGPNLLEHAYRYPRPDVDAAFPERAGGRVPAGFCTFARVDVGEAATRGDLLFLTRSGGAAVLSFAIEDPVGGPLAQVAPLLSALRPDDADAARLLSEHVGPAVEARWKARRPGPGNPREFHFGEPPAEASCSIVVPLYGRCDFLMYQLSQFARDPEFADVDLLYVVDDPHISEATLRLAREVAPLWPVPFRVLDLGQNLGYAGANNAGARAARSSSLLLLNSDVLPDRPGWLGRLLHKQRLLPRCGALAPRLLFEDGSIQHDGIGFSPHPRIPAIWLNDHPGKGLPPDLGLPPEDVEVLAVTGACMLVHRETYLDLGGFDEGYVVGDFEDSDFCLRLRERDLLSYCARSETLYHLERQSQALLGDDELRAKLTLYNAWRHTRRWHATLEQLATTGRGSSR